MAIIAFANNKRKQISKNIMSSSLYLLCIQEQYSLTVCTINEHGPKWMALKAVTLESLQLVIPIDISAERHWNNRFDFLTNIYFDIELLCF